MKRFISLLLIFIVITGCSRLTIRGRGVIRAEKLMEQGKYSEAVFKLEEVLKVYPDYEPAQLSFAVAYPGAISQAEMHFEQAKYKYKLEDIANSLEKLYLIKSAAANLSPELKSMILINYPTQDELDILKKDVAVSFYDAAQELEEKQLNREQLKKRFYLYKRAMYYYPDYIDVKERYKTSKEAALQRVLIKAAPYKHKYMDLGEEIRQNTIEKICLNELAFLNSYKEFENYLNKIGITVDELEKKGTSSKEILLKGNTLINIEVIGVNCTEPQKNVFSEEKFWIEKYDTETKLGKMVEEVGTPEKPSIEYRTHRYRQYNYTMLKSLSINVNYEVIDLSNGEIIKSGTINKVDTDTVQWSQYGNDKIFSFKIPDIPPGVVNEHPRNLKSESEMLEKTMDIIGNELAYIISKILI